MGEIIECLLESILIASALTLQLIYEFEIVILGIVFGFGHVREIVFLHGSIKRMDLLLDFLFVDLPSIVNIHFTLSRLQVFNYYNRTYF